MCTQGEIRGISYCCSNKFLTFAGLKTFWDHIKVKLQKSYDKKQF